MELEKLKLHFLYLVCILVFFLILIATGAWTERPNFTEYLANAATMTSIVLGLVAIFYSFISNDGLSKSLGNIVLVSDGIARSNAQVDKFIVHAEQLNSTASNNTALLDTVSKTVEINLNTVSNLIREMNNQTSILQATVSQLPTRLDELETKFVETTKDFVKPEQITDKAISQSWSKKDIESFLDRSSINANLLVFACVLVYKNKKELSMINLAELIGSSIPNFLNGFLSATHALGLVSRTIIKGKEKTYKISKVNSELENYDIKEYFKRLETRQAITPEDLKKWLNTISKIEDSLLN